MRRRCALSLERVPVDLTYQQHFSFPESLQPGAFLQSNSGKTKAIQAPVQVPVRKVNPFFLLLAIMLVHYSIDAWNIRALESIRNLQLNNMCGDGGRSHSTVNSFFISTIC